MAFAPPKIPDGSALRLRLSSWTPLNHQRINHKVFEERRALLGKWFDKWTDGQRRRILLDLLERCSPSQQKFCAGQLRVPVEAVDFSTTLPRVLSLHIFSFLDPRSLCRCAQVSWPWKALSELDQLWMPKCCRFGWRLGPGPSPAAPGAWKKLYVAMVRELRIARPETPAKAQLVVAEAQPGKRRGPEGKRSVGTTRELRPWRPADRNPADTAQSYNHLDNLDPTEQARRAGIPACLRSRGTFQRQLFLQICHLSSITADYCEEGEEFREICLFIEDLPLISLKLRVIAAARARLC
nr:F-box only protein 16 [Lonchura striata domestica]